MKQKNMTTLLEIMVIILLGAGVLLLIPYQVRLPANVTSNVTDPQMFPKIFAWTLILVGFLRLYLFIKGAEKSNTGNNEQIDIIKLLSGLAVIFAYATLMPLLGYIITTILSIFLLIYLLGRPQWYKALLCALVATIIIWVAFHELLHVPLPSGLLGI